MIFSRIAAGIDQSMRRNTRKPRLNHDDRRCSKSLSTGLKSGWSRSRVRRSSRIETSAAVPPGARFNRRISSCRRGSEAA
jgi:hypothetical protein